MNGPAENPLKSKTNLFALGDDVVYVKPISVASLPEPLRAQAGERETIFALHDADGTQLALVADRQLAFMLARRHDKVPMTVH